MRRLRHCLHSRIVKGAPLSITLSHMNTCPHCSAPVNPLKLLFLSTHYRCGRCGGLARLSDRSRFLIPGAYAAVIFPFVWFSPSHWGSWAAGFLFFVLSCRGCCHLSHRPLRASGCGASQMNSWLNHSAAGNAGLAFWIAIGRHRSGVPEPDRYAEAGART
jgi:hypothetical protein